MVLGDLTAMIMLGGGFEFVVAPLDQCAPGSPPNPWWFSLVPLTLYS